MKYLMPEQNRAMIRYIVVRIAQGWGLALGQKDEFSVEFHWDPPKHPTMLRQLDKLVIHRPDKKPYERRAWGNIKTQNLVNALEAAHPGKEGVQTVEFEALP